MVGGKGGGEERGEGGGRGVRGRGVAAAVGGGNC